MLFIMMLVVLFFFIIYMFYFVLFVEGNGIIVRDKCDLYVLVIFFVVKEFCIFGLNLSFR